MNRLQSAPLPALPGDAVASAEGGGANDAGGAGAKVLAPVLRHWAMVLAVWILGMGVAVPYVWMTKKPAYTATAQIKVDPILSNPLDRQMQTIPLFESFVASQATLLSSRPVLEKALADPRVQQLPADQRPKAVNGLRASLLITPAARTQIIELSVSSLFRASALVLTDAVLDAYLALYGGTTDINQKLEALRKPEKDLTVKLDAKREERRRFSSEFNADTEMLEKLRERDMKTSETYRQQLAESKLDLITLEQTLKSLKAGEYVPDTEGRAGKIQAAVDRDPDVIALDTLVLEETTYLAKNRRGMTADNIAAAQKKIEKLKSDLGSARIAAAKAYEQSQRDIESQMRGDRIASAQIQLERERARHDRLQELILEQERIDTRRGQVIIEIGRIDEEITKLTAELDHLQEARSRLEMIRDQPGPGRVSKASAAEILPDGYSDKRKKLTIAAVLGSLFFGVFLAIVRGRLDARLHAPDDVASGTGLQILGAVPAINDLRKGRITEEEFAEAYRMLRVSILSPTWGEPPRSILITSAQAREGKTSLALSLSVSLAEMGKRVLLIDADLQAPKIGNLLNVETPSQLQYVLSGERDLASSATPSRLTNVDVLLGSAYAEGGLVEQQSAERLISEATARYDFVVVDSSPALGSADALVWSQAVDRVVVSTVLGTSDLRATQGVCQRLAMVGANVLGAVVCNVPVRQTFTSVATSTYRSYNPTRSRPGGDQVYLPVMRSGEDAQ